MVVVFPTHLAVEHDVVSTEAKHSTINISLLWACNKGMPHRLRDKCSKTSRTKQRLPKGSPSRTPLCAGDDIINPTPLKSSCFDLLRRYQARESMWKTQSNYFGGFSHTLSVTLPSELVSQSSFFIYALEINGLLRLKTAQKCSELSVSETKDTHCEWVARLRCTDVLQNNRYEPLWL